MSFGSNVTPPRFGAGAIKDKIEKSRQERKEFEPTWEANIRAAPGLSIEYLKSKEGFDITDAESEKNLRDYKASLEAGKPVGGFDVDAEPDPEPVPNLPVHMNDITLNDCYRCGHRGNNPVPGCGCCAREHHYAPPDPED